MVSKIEHTLKLLKKYKAEKVILFGSHARGSSDPYSDIDLVIIKKTKKLFLDRIKDVLKIIKPNFAIDILVYTPEEFQKMSSDGNPFLEFVVKEGKIIYEKTDTESKRWLDQAKYDLHASRWNAKGTLFAPACFWAQQSAEKAVKAYLYSKGERFVIGHSVAELLEKCKAYDKDFKGLIPIGAFLDRFTYPRGIPMASLVESLRMFTERKILLRQSKWPKRFLTSYQVSSQPVKNSLA